MATNDFSPGDHLFRLIPEGKIIYHHGICLGRDLVAHVFGEVISEAKPIISKIKDFALGQAIFTVDHQPESCLPVDIVCEISREFVSGDRKFGDYNLVSNNCEHFALLCKTGQRNSYQSEMAKFACKFAAETILNHEISTDTAEDIASTIGLLVENYLKHQEKLLD